MKIINFIILAACVLLMLGSTGYGADYVGIDACNTCHSSTVETYLQTLHPYKVQGLTDTETPVLRTMIDGEEVSIFDSRTEGYATYIAPWADYFNEANVVYTIGGKGWKQRFMTQVIPETVDGTTYTGFVNLTGNDYVVMGITWNKKMERWQDYQGPTGANNWYTEGRQFAKKCAGCHTTGSNPYTGSWVEKDSNRMAKGVTCESCHGPASDHVSDPLNEAKRPTNPKDLTFKQQFELCGSCHGRGSSMGTDGQAGPYGYPYSSTLDRLYEPGDDLGDFYIQTTSASGYWPNGNTKKHHQQYNDSLLSGHTAAGVGCISCHTSHTSDHAHQTRREGNSLCTECHTDYADPVAYREHSAHDPGTAKCIDCHMPYTAKSMNSFDIRSHTFDAIPPAQTIAEGGDPDGFSGPLVTSYVPNSCNSKCHNGQDVSPLKKNRIGQMGFEYILRLNDLVLDGDVNADGIVDTADFGILSGNWLKIK